MSDDYDTFAYAYKDVMGEILVPTISATENAAMVNVIVIATYRNVIPLDTWTDEQIKEAFVNATGGKGEIIGVRIREL